MEPTEILIMFGLTMEQVGFVSGVVLLLCEVLKGKFPTVFTGWKTDAAAIVIAGLASIKMVYPDWTAVVALTLAAWLLPAGVHKMIKRVSPNV